MSVIHFMDLRDLSSLLTTCYCKCILRRKELLTYINYVGLHLTRVAKLVKFVSSFDGRPNV